MQRASVALILALAFCGIAVSAYLAGHEASGTPLICNVEGLSDCNTVVASEYSHLWGISLASYGLLFYTMLFVLAAFELVLANQVLRRLLQLFALAGIAASLYSVYTQLFIIHARCVYCFISAVLTVLILLLASVVEPLPRVRKRMAATA